MMRGTTPTHTFEIPIEEDVVDYVRVVYFQSDKRIIAKDSKNDSSCTVSGNTVTVRLSQEETFLFTAGKSVQIQLRVLTKTGDCLGGEVTEVSVERCLDNEVMA